MVSSKQCRKSIFFTWASFVVIDAFKYPVDLFSEVMAATPHPRSRNDWSKEQNELIYVHFMLLKFPHFQNI